MKGKKIYSIALISFLVFSFLAIFITYPLIFHLGNYVTGYGDELFIAFVQNWVIHSLLTNPSQLFNASFYFPYHNTLAYSDLFFTSSILSLIPLFISKQPIVVINFTLISSIVFVGFSLYLLCYFVTKNYFSSLIAGILVIFAPAFLDKKVHLQILNVEWIPLSILFFLLFVQKKHTKYLVTCLLFFLLQTYNSFLPGYFLVFFFFTTIFYYWFYNRKELAVFLARRNIAAVFISFISLVPIIIPYYAISNEFHAVRDIRDTIHFALQPEDLIYPNEHTRLQNILLSIAKSEHLPANAELKTGYLGITFSLLAVFSIIYWIKTFKKKNIILNVFVIVAFLGLLTSFGPLLHLQRVTIHKPFPIPLPYAVFYYLLPGFQGFRNSQRWEILFILCIAVVIAIVLAQVLRKFSDSKKIVTYTVIILCVIAEYNFPMHFYSVPQVKEFPPIYSWLETTPTDSTVIFLPIYNWNSFNADEEMKREYFATVSFRKMVNGYSGFSPPPWQTFVIYTQRDFPNEVSIQSLKKIGVNYIIINPSEYDKLFAAKQSKYNGRTIISLTKVSSSLRLYKKIGEYDIFTYK